MPANYFEMIDLLKNCSLVLTDSGGLQKEAFFLGKYCLTLRGETEWKELVDLKRNFICSDNTSIIVDLSRELFNKTFNPSEVYGDGRASKK